MATTEERHTDDLTGGPNGPLRAGVRVHLQERDLVEPRSFVGRLSGGDDGIAVELLDPLEDGDLRQGAGVRLTCTTDDGLYLANTTVRRREESSLVLDQSGTSRWVQRRRHRRVPVQLSLQCRRLGDEAPPVLDVEAVDLSKGGVRILAPEGLQVGDVVLLTLADAGESVGYRGLVVDVRDAAERPGKRSARVAFSGFTEAMEAALGQLLSRHAPEISG